MDNAHSVDALVDSLIEREGGGTSTTPPTAAARRAGGLPKRSPGPTAIAARCATCREEASEIYRRLYWLRPQIDTVAQRSDAIAAELFDTGVNMGPAVAVAFLQRALTALNRNGSDYSDLTRDGRIGPMTLAALDAFFEARGTTSGERVLLRALEALQGERYIRLAERRPANEAFLYGWLANRVG